MMVAILEKFMTSKRYTEEFKVEAVKQITERNYSVYFVRLSTAANYPAVIYKQEQSFP